FTDYQGYSSNNPKQGGTSSENDCKKAFRTELEDVETSIYYTTNGVLPDVNTAITIIFNGLRIVAVVNGQEIGNLPTKYNYLRKCMDEITYSGVVANTSDIPINSITINVSPNE